MIVVTFDYSSKSTAIPQTVLDKTVLPTSFTGSKLESV